MGRASSRPRGQHRPGQGLEPHQITFGLPQSTAFCEPLIHNGRMFLINTGKANAFIRQHAAVNRLSFDKTMRTQAHHTKKALQLPTAAESCCDIPLTFLKALGPMAKSELLSIFNESFSKGGWPGIWKEATILPLKKAGKPSPRRSGAGERTSLWKSAKLCSAAS